jgi:hypothetical protein
LAAELLIYEAVETGRILYSGLQPRSGEDRETEQEAPERRLTEVFLELKNLEFLRYLKYGELGNQNISQGHL